VEDEKKIENEDILDVQMNEYPLDLQMSDTPFTSPPPVQKNVAIPSVEPKQPSPQPIPEQKEASSDHLYNVTDTDDEKSTPPPMHRPISPHSLENPSLVAAFFRTTLSHQEEFAEPLRHCHPERPDRFSRSPSRYYAT
jgi:hypothetical protein